MPTQDAHAIRLAGKTVKKALYSTKVPLSAIREHYDEIFGTVFLPNNVDRTEVEIGSLIADYLVPELAIGKRTILYAHGGGFISGSRKAARNLCASLAHESAARLLLPEYRLAPEHPFPAALEDLYASYVWLIHQGLAPGDIVLAGNGAGANLALALVQFLAERGMSSPLAVVALSPWMDLSLEDASAAARRPNDPINTVEALSAKARLYTFEANLKNPLVSPIHANYTAFPNLYVQCGSEEILLDDAKRLAARAESEGGDVTLDVEDGMWHGFQAFDRLTPRARIAVARVGSWIRAGARSAPR